MALSHVSLSDAQVSVTIIWLFPFHEIAKCRIIDGASRFFWGGGMDLACAHTLLNTSLATLSTTFGWVQCVLSRSVGSHDGLLIMFPVPKKLTLEITCSGLLLYTLVRICALSSSLVYLA
jgi:hypothetical protein